MTRVLIVEDETDLLDIWVEDLRLAGNAVVGVADGLEAAELIHSQPFDLVLLDAGLPGLSGLELLRRIRSADTRLPVVFITGNVSPKVTRAIVEAGASDILFKPLVLQDLHDVVTRMAR